MSFSSMPFASRLAPAWRASAPLTVTAAAMLTLFAATVAALWLDPRTIGGMPAWVKPAKFAISIALYAATLAWFFTYLPGWRRTRAVVGWTTAGVMAVEFTIIALQAWRGRASHFNIATPLDTALFAIMGASIVLQTVVAIAAAVALWRQRFDDHALGWALRLGMTISIVGAASAGLMTSPTTHQLESARAGAPLTVVGAHTVGAADGGAGMPGTGWSREHGDLRVAHFLGLHALQVLPLVALLLRRSQVPRSAHARLVQIAGGSHAVLLGLLLWQALRGQSLLQPDAATLAALSVWGAATVGAACLVAARSAVARVNVVTV